MRASRKRRRRLLTAGAVALIAAVIIADSRWRITSAEYDLSYENLPESFCGFRIVQLSDLHMMQFGRDNRLLLEAVRKQRPDIIVMTGDFINRSGKSDGPQGEKLTGFLSELSQLAPCYYVSGNHDWASGELADFAQILSDCGICYLKNQYVLLERDGESIILAGAEDPNGRADMPTPYQFIQRVREEQGDKFTVLLGHRNNWPKRYPLLDVDLIFCGHSHGGIVRLPFIGGLLGTEMNLFPKYDKGVFNEGRYDMVVSAGLGNSAPVPRFLNPPQLVTVVLDKK